MFIAVVAVTAAANLLAAWGDFRRTGWILDNMTRYGVPHGWLTTLGVAKAAGGVGLLLGLALPALAVVSAAGLTVYFVAALVTVARARVWSHLPAPTVFLALGAASLALAV